MLKKICSKIKMEQTNSKNIWVTLKKIGFTVFFSMFQK